MSMFSIASSILQSGLETVSWNGYRLTTTRSIGLISFSDITFSSTPLRAKIPPCILGFSVLTRPAIISG